MIDPNDGRITSVIIATGGTLGMGSNTISVPWSSVKIGQDRGKVIVTASQTLETAPTNRTGSASGTASPVARIRSGTGGAASAAPRCPSEHKWAGLHGEDGYTRRRGGMPMSLRALIEGSTPVTAPLVLNPLMARMAESAGFPADTSAEAPPGI